MRNIECLLGFRVVAAALVLAGCGSGGTASPGENCVTGDVRCKCFGNGTCNGQLQCLSNLCVDLSQPPVGTGGIPATGGTVGAACTVGAERCPCYANSTCNGTLQCLSNLCVDLSQPPVGTGGISATGGVSTPPASTCSDGMERCFCYPNNTCNAGLLCVSKVCVAPPGAGGIPATGSVPSTGGIVFATGGVIGTGGIATGTGGSNSPTQVCSDSTHCYLGMDDLGGVPGGGNAFGIEGGFYAVGDSCATLTWDAATHCASGTVCAKDPPYYLNWGVEIGMTLKSSGGYDYGYDATANGVTGFFWEVTGTAPGMAVWLPQTAGLGACLTTSNKCTVLQPPWGNSMPSMGPSGSNFVMLSTMSMDYEDWGLGYVYPPAWDPTRIHSIQWKIPAGDYFSSTFNFCVKKVGVIHN